MRFPVLICAVLALTASRSDAQQEARGYVQAIAGFATTSATDAIFGGGAAIRATGRVDVFGELGHLRNGIWTSLDDELTAAGEAIKQQIATQFGTDTSVSFDARVPVWYGLGGARVRDWGFLTSTRRSGSASRGCGPKYNSKWPANVSTRRPGVFSRSRTSARN
jgi:hypothetical protein